MKSIGGVIVIIGGGGVNGIGLLPPKEAITTSLGKMFSGFLAGGGRGRRLGSFPP